MTAGPQMPEWPYSNLLDIDPDFYEQRILDCWEARCRLAVKELQEARLDVEHWAGYASGYFKDKWDLAGDLKRMDEALAAIGPLPEASP